MMCGAKSCLDIHFRNMVRSTRQVHYQPEVGQGSDTQGTATTQDTQPRPFAPPPLVPVMAPLLIGANQLQQLLGARADDGVRATKNFQLYGGTRYDGLGGALKALAWVEGCEEAFADMTLTSIQQRALAARHLDGPALQWWRVARVGLDLSTYAWEDFLLRFHAKFVPLSERNKLSEAFITLRQGAFSATALINRFNELNRFAPFMVDTEEKQVERILHCLNPQLAILC